MIVLKGLKKAALFGLDARIALAVLAVTSLSIALTKEKKTFEQQEIETKQQMRVLESKFLKYWEKDRFAGYYTARTYPVGDPIQSRSDTVSILGGTENVKRYSYINGYGMGCKADFTHFQNGETYNQCFPSPRVSDYRMSFSVNVKNGFYTTDTLLGNYLSYLLHDAASRVYFVYKALERDEGIAIIKDSDKFVYDSNFTTEVDTWAYKVFNGARFANKRDVKMYFILEASIDSYSPSDYILHVVMYSNGANRKLDTVMPKNINEIAAFAGAQGDDIVHIFNTRDVYLRAKAENNRRLTEIKAKIEEIANANYLDRMSLCATEVTPSTSCDLNTDGVFDVKDENLILDLNPFPKSSLDTSSASYYDNTVAFNAATNATALLRNTLGLPEYYAYDLFGNYLNYQSNILLKEKGPYSMEVWY